MRFQLRESLEEVWPLATDGSLSQLAMLGDAFQKMIENALDLT